MELAKSVAFVKSHAREWNIDTNRIFVCGFSAGGHLAACLGMMWNREFLYAPLNAAPEDIQPTGMILCYPVITSGEFGHKRSFEQLLGDRAGDPQAQGTGFPGTSGRTADAQDLPVAHLDRPVRACGKFPAAGPSPEKGRRQPGNTHLPQRTPRTVPGYGRGLRQHGRLPRAPLSGWMELAKEWIKEKDRE